MRKIIFVMLTTFCVSQAVSFENTSAKIVADLFNEQGVGPQKIIELNEKVETLSKKANDQDQKIIDSDKKIKDYDKKISDQDQKIKSLEEKQNKDTRALEMEVGNLRNFQGESMIKIAKLEESHENILAEKNLSSNENSYQPKKMPIPVFTTPESEEMITTNFERKNDHKQRREIPKLSNLKTIKKG